MTTFTPDPTGSGEPIVYDDLGVTVYHGNCLDVLRTMPDASVDSFVTDPQYGLSNISATEIAQTVTAWAAGQRDLVPDGRGFMGHEWDAFVPPPAVWDECLRVLKPGGHLLAFAGTRMFDLMTLSIRFAGFEIRDNIADLGFGEASTAGLTWLYGTGFPKSLDVSKAIDKAAGATREVVGPYVAPDGKGRPNSITDADFRSRGYQAMQGYRPAGDGYPGEGLNGSPKTITAPSTPAAQQWSGWGTSLKPGFEPIVVARKPLAGTVAANVLAHGTGALNIDACRVPATDKAAFPVGYVRGAGTTYAQDAHTKSMASSSSEDANPHGRWPTNVVLDGDTADALDEQSGDVAKFFPVFRYQAKAPTHERPTYITPDGRKVAHPTVKPVPLLRWLVRLVTPPGGRVLDTFAGTGTTGEAAVLEGFEAILVEREADYIPLIRIRLDALAASRATRAAPAVAETPSLFDQPTEEAS